MDAINKTAARWWKDRFYQRAKADALESALLERLPIGDWDTYNDYDPDGILLDAIRAIGIECRGCAFSGRELFPSKTGIQRRDNKLFAKSGYGVPWTEVLVTA